jgi:superkiller protein 3
MRRIIREEEPPRPSTRISTLGQAATTVSTQRKSDPKRLRQLCRGELDWIVMKALEKDRNRRYETANGFARDIQRYLADEPVQACPPSAWYRFRKFARRKKTALLVAACVVLALAGIAGGLGWAVRDRAAQEGERLAREEALDRAVASTLDETGPLIEQGQWPEALAVVERADKLLAAAGRTERPAQLLELHNELVMAERLEGISQQPKQDLQVPVLMSSEDGSGYIVQQRAASSEDDFFTGRQADAAFGRAFRDCGIDIDALAPAEAAGEIARRGVRLALVKALDEWAPLRRWGRGDNDPGWKKLIEIASLADPDPWRNRCREALLRRDRKALEELAEAVPIPQAPAKTLWLLGLMLKEAGAPDKAVSLLRRAQHQYPTDFWINDELGALNWAFDPPRTEDALRFYSIALTLRPTRPQLHSMVARILGAKGAVEEAVVEYSKAIDLDPKNVWAWNGRAWACNELHQYDKALADCNKAIELDPKNVRAWSNRGFAYLSLHEYAKALVDCSKAVELDPKSAPAHYNLGVVLREQRKLDEAVAECRKAIELDPKYAPAHNGLGNALARQGKVDDAIVCFKKAIDLDPKCAIPHSNLGNALHEQKKLDEAVAEWRKAIELDPKYAPAHNNLGNALKRQGKLDEAVAEYHKAIDLDPKFALPHDGLGSALFDRDRLEEAISEYRKAIALDPKNAGAHGNLGRALQKKGLLDEAIAELRETINLDPEGAGEQARAHSSLGTALGEKGLLDEAIAEYRRAIELDPKRVVAYNNLGEALRRQGKLDEAVAHFRKATALDPKFASAHSNLGVALGAQGKLDEAVAEYHKAIALDPKSAPAHNGLGVALGAQGKLEEAIAEYRKAIALDPKFADAHCNLGRALQQQGKFRQALEELRRGHELASRRRGWPYPSAEWVRQCERLVELDEKLDGFLDRKATPASAAERIELAQLCSLKHLHRAAARFYEDAFAAQPKLAEELNSHRYNAACAAALAGCGQGKDADKLDEKEKARLRGQALAWLRADLEAVGRLLDKEPNQAHSAAGVGSVLRHWQVDTDLAGVRGVEALAQLPEAERPPWKNLWDEVADALARAQTKMTPAKKSDAK